MDVSGIWKQKRRKTLLIRNILLGLILLNLGVSAALPPAIQNFIERDKIDRNHIGILISETKTGRLLAEHRADHSFLPASVIKLATTYAALLEFGSDWRWPTRFYYTGAFDHGVIEGDIVVRAYGDPTLSIKDIPSVVKRLKQVGVRHVRGNLLIDRSFFSVGGRISSGFDNHPYSEYNAMPDALMFDDHLCRISIDTASGVPIVKKETPDNGYHVVNKLHVVSKACRRNYSWPRIKVDRESDVPTVILSGKLSRHCPPRVIKRVLDYPYTGFYGALRQEMEKQGITMDGQLKLGKTPENARALINHHSAPLKKILAKTNKKSNNLYARHIFLLLGARVQGLPGTESKGRKAVRKILSRKGIMGEETKLDNGCGLSRRSRTTARMFQRLLQHAYRHYGWEWIETLAIAGIDGTIKKRFRNTPVKHRAWLKTGTLKNAKNIAGYVKGRSGRLYTVVILYNGQKRWKGSLLQNQILKWIVTEK
jgi:D-alanyl-D-alanine carboxypeptidase/D-alanyl-D-alanine-endopeptidase (penicillin-binding protein 4)